MPRHNLDIDNLVQRYLAGESEKGLADSLKVSRNVIRRRLVETGTPIRGRSQAETVKWSRMSKTQRATQVTAAHDAVRGSTRSIVAKARGAATIERNWSNHATPDELELRRMLLNRGLATIAQQQIGVYNCDLGAFPIAVEIFGGNWHWTGRHQARLRERFRYFFDTGWHVLVVHVTDRTPITERTADHIVTWHDATRGDPTLRREYRMIRGDSEPVFVCDDSDQITDVFPFSSRRDPATGRYESVAR